MEITESIYKGVVETSRKKPTREDANVSGHSSQKRGEAASSWTHPEKGESAGKRIKRRVYILIVTSKTFLIHIPRHPSE